MRLIVKDTISNMLVSNQLLSDIASPLSTCHYSEWRILRAPNRRRRHQH